MAYTTINDPSEYFNTVLYSGNGKDDRPVIGTGFQPDWIWYKERTNTSEHRSFDSSRGASERLEPNNLNAEATDTSNHKSFDSDGFTVGTSGSTNAIGDDYVAWQWKANGNTATHSQSESGSNMACSVQANSTAGFSIITHTGTGGTGHTFLHGLGSAPAWFLTKRRSGTENWLVYHHKNTANPETDHLLLDTTAATDDSETRFDDTAPNATEIAAGNNAVINADASTYVTYAFKEIQGYSKFGSYKGNGAQDGTFVYTGFRPAWLMIKRTDAAKNWYIADSKRSPTNITKAFLVANDSAVEDTSGDTSDAYFDILSNGFKLRQDFSHLNADGGTHVYMAFAESPFVTSNGTPNNAR